MSRFVKHRYQSAEDSLICEADGLAALRQALDEQQVSEIKIPDVYQCDAEALVMQHIDAVTPTVTQWRQLGEGLARLHQAHRPYFGYHQDNYIGLNPQKNVLIDDWGAFFVKFRLAYQVQRINDRILRQRFNAILEKQTDLLRAYFNRHCGAASLVHGDLWQGNVLFDLQQAWLIDPAVYFADREVDLAMTEMFGGFHSAFYQAYDAIYPRSLQYETKKHIYNLYHYLNHFNLFGVSYLPACEKGFHLIASLSHA